MHILRHIRQLWSHGGYWQFLYRRRRQWHGVSTGQIVASQVFTVVASVAAGFLLDISKETLVYLAGTLLMLPGIIDLAASLTGAMCAKINHQIDATRAPVWVVVTQAVVFALFVGVVAGLLVGIVGGLLAMWLFGASMLKMIGLSVIAMALTGVLVYPLMGLLVVLIRRLNMNPDNIAGPVESSVVDIVAVLVVAMVAGWLA